MGLLSRSVHRSSSPQMPVSLWNDRPYDSYAIFTGSATVVDGQVVHVYPGLCNRPQPGTACPAGTNLAIAVPEDPTDPLQTNVCLLCADTTFVAACGAARHRTCRDDMCCAAPPHTPSLSSPPSYPSRHRHAHTRTSPSAKMANPPPPIYFEVLL